MSESGLCFLCKSQFRRPKDKYVIEGRSKENLPFELNSLPFGTPFHSGDYLCRNCVYALKKRRRLVEQLREIEEKLQSQFEKEVLASPSRDSVVKRSITEDNLLQSKRPHTDTPCVSEKFDFSFGELSPPCKPLLHSTPVKSIASVTCGETSVTTQKACRTAEEPTEQHSKTNVFVKVEWPSKDRERQLPPDFESLGKMLLRGTYKQIACAVWNNKRLKKELLLNIMKDVDKECASLCSKKKPSCLRSPTKDQLLNFSMKKLDTELQERIPITYAMLTAASVNAREKTNLRSNKVENYSIAVGMAAAVCLRNRSMFMNAVQLQISIFTYHTGWLVSVMIFSIQF